MKARHQLQLALLQVHIEGGVASALLAFDRTGSLEHTLDRAQRSRLAAHIRLADTFLCRGMDHGMCTLAERLHEDA